MAGIPKTLLALEDEAEIERAIGRLRALVMRDATEISNSKHPLNWNHNYGYWAKFGAGNRSTYWNGFGDFVHRNIIVEINPPKKGRPAGSQGLIARDKTGNRWILHAGRIHPGEHRVDARQFQALSGLRPVNVRLSDGSTLPYFVVAPLDGKKDALHAGIVQFIERCVYVRTSVLFGEDEAQIDQAVREAEQPSQPEKGGSYVIPPRPARFANRRHADVWAALAAELDKRDIRHSNARVGRYGPDLRTLTKPLVLFEIKTAMSAQTVYEALGQLLTYERILKQDYAKVLIAPTPPPPRLGIVLSEFGIQFLKYGNAGKKYSFGRTKLDSILL